MTTPDPQQIELERLLFRYSMALERGDFETITTILHMAANDAALNRMIQELDAVYALESTSNPSFSGEPPMAQLTRPLILPRKQKSMPTNRRSLLLFPFAAVMALALVGVGTLMFKPPSNPYQGQPGMRNTATSTPLPYLQPPTNLPMGYPTFTPTPVPFSNNVPTLVPSAEYATFTPTAAGPTPPPTIVPFDQPTIIPTAIFPGTEPLPTLVPFDLSAIPTVPFVYCSGMTQDEDIRVFQIPFPDKPYDDPIGLYAPNTPVVIYVVQIDPATGQHWYYVNLQGWVNVLDVVIPPECANSLSQGAILGEATDLLNRLQLLSPNPMVLVPTAPSFPSVSATPTAVP